jgi:hypothetical protein
MKHVRVFIILLFHVIGWHAVAGEYGEALKGLAQSNNLVIRRDRSKDRQGDVIPSLEAEICRLNQWPPPSPRIVSSGNCIGWWYYGTVLSLQDVGQNPPMVLLLTPERYFDENGKRGDVRLPFGKDDDYFIVPLKNPENVRLASVPKSLWFAEFKKDLSEFHSAMNRIETLPDEEKTAKMLLLEADWDDVRGLAVLERLLEQKDSKLQDIISLIAAKSADYQFKAAQVLMEARSLSKVNRLRIFDAREEPVWPDGVKHLTKLLEYLLPEPTRKEAVAILKPIEDREMTQDK